ncbi:28420_t:CDS:2 [Gigaspora margarita]|uniref:28420_t:CDS:1 n=1 Tax=Gigaspora margarita TaxID=4874 RepID=A0ABN7VNI9_GIGMA|nr:28420_t:CDS:2 [Gigaspora margarita]
MKLEQKQTQNDAMHGSCGARDQRSLASKISTIACLSKPKSLEEIETDNFLDLESKKEVSNIIRRKNREKKLLQDNKAPASQTQESHNTSSTMPTPLIPSEVSISDGDNSSEILLQSNGTNMPESLDLKTIVQEKGNREYCSSDTTALCQNSSTVLLLDLAQLFDKATDAEYSAIKANQEETLY